MTTFRRLLGQPSARHPARLVAALLMAAALGVAHAQGDPAADPPGRAARLSEVSGQVWFFDPDAGGEWTAAAPNRPVTTGDRLATDPGARAEIQLGSTTLRLDAGAELEVSQLDDSRFALHLLSGSVYARVADLDVAGPIEIDTDVGRFPILRNGSYRVDQDGATSRLSVINGQARYEGQNSGMAVNPGQRAEFWIDSGGVAQYTMASPVNDPFLAWNNERDRQLAAPVSARYVSPEMTGVADLDRYGRWEQTPDYGAVWIPTAVAADWAPYRDGHWAWVPPWGWTWVDDAPWGFAPFHYGRWVYARNNWCWTPGERVVRPVYAPALVAWVGGPRANVGITVGGGPAVGWFPLAPREVFVPSYRVSPRYAQGININIVGNPGVITRVFANPAAPRDFGNRRWPGAVTVVPAAVMTSRQPIAPAWAQWRQNPAAREIAAQPPGRGAVALLAPPVAAPSLRHVDPREVRPPPGFAERGPGQRPGPGGAGGPPERDRDGRGRDVARPESPRPPQAPGVLPMQPTAPLAPSGRPAPGQAAPPAAAAPPAVVAPGAQRPGFNGPDGRREDPRDDRRTGAPNERRGDPRAQPGMPAAPPGAAPTQPALAPTQPAAIARPQVPTTVQEGPMMRARPVQRGDARDQRESLPREQRENGQRPAAPAAPPPQVAPPARVQPPPRPDRPAPAERVERPAPTTPAPAPVARPAEPPRAAPPAPAAPEMRRPEPQHRDAPPGGERRGGGDERRNEQQR